MFESFKPKTQESTILKQESIEDSLVGIFEKIDSLYKENPYSFKTLTTIVSLLAVLKSAPVEAANFEALPDVAKAEQQYNDMVQKQEEVNKQADWSAINNMTSVTYVTEGGNTVEVKDSFKVPEFPRTGSGSLAMKSSEIFAEQKSDNIDSEYVQQFLGISQNYTLEFSNENATETGEVFSYTIMLQDGQEVEKQIVDSLVSHLTPVAGYNLDQERSATNQDDVNGQFDSQFYRNISSSLNIHLNSWKIESIKDGEGNTTGFNVTYELGQNQSQSNY